MNHGPLKLLQLSDLHLRDHDGKILCDSLESVVQACQQSANWPPHFIVLTGDLVHDESTEGYRQSYTRLAQRFNPLAHVLAVPGNHDDSLLLQEFMSLEEVQTSGWAEAMNWQIILLDSSVAGKPGGHLSDEEADLLEMALSSRTVENSLIVVHHPPVEINSDWLDRMKIDNAEKLFDICSAYSGVHHLICGHAHQEIDLHYRGIHILGAPATCKKQFLPNSDVYAEDSVAPGARWLLLHSDGRIETEVTRAD